MNSSLVEYLEESGMTCRFKERLRHRALLTEEHRATVSQAVAAAATFKRANIAARNSLAAALQNLRDAEALFTSLGLTSAAAPVRKDLREKQAPLTAKIPLLS